jgi:hypothetical protein
MMLAMSRASSLAALLLALAPAAPAHHSYAMFDRSRALSIAGTVKELQWTNPHSWLQLLVAQPDGSTLEYGFESNGPDFLRKAGWTRASVKPGDPVSVLYNPLRNGDRGGELLAVTRADGTRLPATLPGSSSVAITAQ